MQAAEVLLDRILRQMAYSQSDLGCMWVRVERNWEIDCVSVVLAVSAVYCSVLQCALDICSCRCVEKVSGYCVGLPLV